MLFFFVTILGPSLANAEDQSGEEMVVHGSPATLELSRGVPVNVVLDEVPGGVVVGNPEIADVNLIGNRSIVIVPKKVGVTALIVTDVNGRLISRITVPVNDPNNVAVWEDGDRTSHWCTSLMCLSDDQVRKKNQPPSDKPGGIVIFNSPQQTQSSTSATTDGQGSGATGGGQTGQGTEGQ